MVPSQKCTRTKITMDAYFTTTNQKDRGKLVCINSKRSKINNVIFPANENPYLITNDKFGKIWASTLTALYVPGDNYHVKKISDLPTQLKLEMREIYGS